MQGVEGSAVMPLSQDETWDVFFGHQMRRLVELHSTVAAVEDYQMRPDGTPRYTMVAKFGPFPMRVISDYSVYEPPRRTVNRVLDSPLGGTAYFTFEPVAGGTRVTQRWEVEPQNPLVGRLLPVMRPLLAWSMQRDLDTLAKRVAIPQGNQQRQVTASRTGLLVGGIMVAAILALYLLLLQRRRSRSSRRRWPFLRSVG